MKINDKEISVNELVKDINNDSSYIKTRGNGIYLSDNDIKVLKKYNINYNKYSSLDSLIFDIEEILNEESGITDLEEISLKLAEFNYYNNTNK